MQEEGLQARVRKRFTCTTMSDHDQPVAANVLDRQFTADAPNRRWVGDTTEFVIRRERQTVPGGDSRFVLAIRGRLVGERR
jgi:transposase InsO family protein